MGTVQIIKSGTDEIIASITEYPDGVRGILADGYSAVIDGRDLVVENEKNRSLGDKR